MAPLGVRLQILDRYVVMDNGILQVTLSNPDGLVTGIRYNGIDNLLEFRNKEDNRGYWDLVWGDPETPGLFDVELQKVGILQGLSSASLEPGVSSVTTSLSSGQGIRGTSFSVEAENDDQVEISFKREWSPSLKGKMVPLNIDKRFVMLRGSSGLYTYGIYEHLQEWPGFNIGETRITFKPSKDRFHYMAIADNRQREMPLPEDRMPPRCQVLAYPEAVLLTNPVEEQLRGEVDDKYQYSCDNKDILVHGWICSDPPTGFWHITPSYEYRSGGPAKQNLTSHVGPTCLTVFQSAHYAGQDLVPNFADGEPWKKVFGPVFIYCNSLLPGEDYHMLWQDAKLQSSVEVQSWPYNFPASDDFPSSDQRGNVNGRLLVKDRYISDDYIPASRAFVGLAAPGDVGSWQRENKGYQFWTNADDNGYFSITNIREGTYNLYAWVPGFIGDYKSGGDISITSGCDVEVGDIVYQPLRDGPTLWEIGIPDRSSSDFYIPDPNPNYVNRLYINHPDRFRQYGLWERYAELYPNEDLVYTIGEGDYRKDWFFAQVTRKVDNGYQGTTWQIKFNLDSVDVNGIYKFRVAIASATLAEMQVRVNDPKVNRPTFTTGLIGRDNSVARHGSHGLYWLYSVDIRGSMLVRGPNNTIFLTQPRNNGPFQGIFYDCIRLEAPPPGC